MCLGIPMKVVKIEGALGVVAAGGLRRKINLSFMSGLKTGDYVLVHAGFAIEKVNEKEARKTLKMLRDVL